MSGNHDHHYYNHHQPTANGNGNQKMSADIEAKWKELPDKYLMVIAQFMAGHINDTDAYEKYNGPLLKSSIKSVYWIFLIQYAVLAALGIFMNVAIIVYIMYHKLYKDVTHSFIVNLALCHFVQCALVLPITLMVMLIQNWVFGQFLCFFLPMLQDIPLHVAIISHILIAFDRMRWLGDPLRGRLPAFVCCCATWLTGMIIALPYPIYTIYVEIGDYVPRLHGIGLCVVNLMDDMQEYMRGLFLILYCGPAILLAYLYIRTSQELRPPEGPFAVMMFEHRQRQRTPSSSSVDQRSSSGIGTKTSSGLTTTGVASVAPPPPTQARPPTTASSSSVSRSYDLYNAELDVYREKRKQRDFGSMAAAQVLCLCPLMILRLARMVMVETYENTKHFDFTYLMFVWIAFLPTVIFPCIYASQILPRTEKERLRGYFRLSSKRFKKSRGDLQEVPIEKDDNTTTTQGSTIIPNGNGYIGRVGNGIVNGGVGGGITLGVHASKTSKHHYGNCKSNSNNNRHYGRDASRLETVSSSKDAFKVNMISNEHKTTGGSGSGRFRMASVPPPPPSKGVNGIRQAMQSSVIAPCNRRLTIDSINNSCSNITSSTYCNNGGGGGGVGGSSSIENGFGDGEDSSIVSGMIVHGMGVGGDNTSYYEKKWGSNLHNKDVSFSDCGSFSRMDSSSTLERDMEIIDLLERERSMDIHDIMERENHGENFRLLSGSGGGERRKLPDLEKICLKSPKQKLDMAYTFERMTVPTASDITTKDMKTVTNSTADANSQREDGEDEEVPNDVFDEDYIPTTTIAPTYSYHHSRRINRKSSHHSNSSHRSKRDSFNSLNEGDLIAGAFGELDPTQPLTKMSVIETRMMKTRNSGRAPNISSSFGRSSLKSRDYNYSPHSSHHPELDFRENIFAEL